MNWKSQYNVLILGKSVLPWRGFFKGPQNDTSYSDSKVNDESAVSRNFNETLWSNPMRKHCLIIIQ